MTAWLTRLSALAAPVLLVLGFLTALGVWAEDVPATPERADARALALAAEVRELAARTVRLGRAVQLRPARAGLRERLRATADRAQAIEAEARAIHLGESSRGDIRRATLAVAEAAAVLARLEPPDAGGDRRRRARGALNRTQRALREAAKELAGTDAPGAEATLRRIRKWIPDVLVAGPPRS